MRRHILNTNTYRFPNYLATVCIITLCLLPCFVWAVDYRDVLGDTSEGLMQDFFQREGWKPVPGQVGRQGIDGLFVKAKNGIVKDVLVVESKYGTSNLGDNLVCGKRQMSQNRIVCKLDDLINSSKKSGSNQESIHQYEQIKKHVEKNNFRSELWRVKPDNGKLRISLQQIKSKGENTMVGKETLNKVVDLKNPQDPYQKWMARKYEENLDKSFKVRDVSDIQRNKIIGEVHKNPAKISQVLKKNVSPSPPIPPPKIKPTVITKRATKGFIKGFGRNLKMGAIGGTAVGTAVPIVGHVVGFLGGVALGMAIDYLVDAAVDSVYASEPTEQNSVEQTTKISKEIKEGAAQTQKYINALEQRMVQEFSILGQDIQNKHNEVMAAINFNISITQDIKKTVEKIHADLLTGIDSLSEQIAQIRIALDSTSSRIDKILDRLDASLKANYSNGIYYLDLYDNVKDMEWLRKAESNLTRFIHTFEGMATKSAEDEDILLMALSYRANALAELFAKTKNEGYAKNSVKDMLAIIKRSTNIDFINTLYLSVMEADLEGEIAQKILPLNKERIRHSLLIGEIDEALKQAIFLKILLNQNKDAIIFCDALFEYAKNGKSQRNVIDFEDPDYMFLAQYIKNIIVFQPATETDYIKNIMAGNATPSDYKQILSRYQNTDFVKFSVCKIVKEGYYEDALDMLDTYPINDYIFRVKAYLLILRETDTDKFHKLQSLVLSNNTYSEDLKKFAKELDI